MNPDLFRIIEPSSEQEWADYFLLRYKVLREPWTQPPGSEKDQLEDQCLHAFLLDENNVGAGVCRLQFNSETIAQIRYMGIRADLQGLGLGNKLIHYMENKALEKGMKRMILEARENAVNFYGRNGYTISKKSYLMWGEIQHYTMEKPL